MYYIYYLILGAFQGLTEFLPVSSSGHLAVIQSFVEQAEKKSLLIEIMAHFGSLMAIAVYYRRSILKAVLVKDQDLGMSLKRLAPLFVSTLPAGLAGLLLKDRITVLFSNLNIVALCFLATSAILYVGSRKRQQLAHDQLSEWPSMAQAFGIGCAQALALLPGISRSGTTISTGVFLGLRPQVAAYFSFLSVAPLILAASALSLLELLQHPELMLSHSWGQLFVLLLSSFAFGWLGLALVIRFLESDKFHYFAFYLVPLALFLLVWGLL